MGGFFNGNSIRLLLLATLVALIGSFVAKEIVQRDEESLQSFLCQTESVLVQCSGLDDYDTCADVDGGVPCVASACGYQLAHHIDVSVSGADDPLAEEGTPTNVLSVFMIFWSIVPYALVLVLIGSFLFLGDTTTLSFVLLMGFMAIINEFVIKNIVEMHRPEGSCLYFRSYGMPSGHSATSIGTLWDFLLEVWVDRPETSVGTKFFLSLAAVVLLVPVLYSRVYLHDHFMLQVAVGAGVGIIVGTLWFLLMYRVARRRLDRWAEMFCCRCFRIRNTYRNSEPWLPPWWSHNPCMPCDEDTVVMANLSYDDDDGKSAYVEMSKMP